MTRPVPFQAAEYLRRQLPDASLKAIEAAGYLPHQTAPDAVIAALARHLPSLS